MQTLQYADMENAGNFLSSVPKGERNYKLQSTIQFFHSNIFELGFKRNKIADVCDFKGISSPVPPLEPDLRSFFKDWVKLDKQAKWIHQSVMYIYCTRREWITAKWQIDQ